MLLAAAVLLTAGAIAYTRFVRERDLPPPVARTGYVLLEIDRIKAQAAAPAPPTPPSNTQCPHCGAKFARAMKFCGECGKAMSA